MILSSIKNLILKKVIFLSIFCLLLSAQAFAATTIEVEGNQRIETETILSYIDQSETLSDVNAANKIFKTLFATGFFKNIIIKEVGDKIIIKVVENPVVDQVAFEGNHRIKDEILTTETKVKPRAIFNESIIQEDVARILAIYRASGRFSAQVEAKFIEKSENRVDVVFEIREGAKTTVSKIQFVGNEAFSDSDLREVVSTKESAWYRFLATTDTYNPDRLSFDQQLLNKFYQKEGYADFKVLSAISEFSPEEESFIITITVSEGVKYQVGEIKVETKLEEVSVEELQDEIPFETGDDYDAILANTVITKFVNELAKQGSPFVNVSFDLEKNTEAKQVNITYTIEQGKRLYVERVNVEGNVRTLDEVIRREILFIEGDPFNKVYLAASERRIKRLGFFKTVTVSTQTGSQPDLIVITVKVEEQPTGDLGFAAGVTAKDSGVDPLLKVTLSERNLLGTGDSIRLTGSLSTKKQFFNASYTRPYFLDTNVTAGIDLFHIIDNKREESSFSTVKTGGGVRFAYPLTDNLSQFWKYTLQFEKFVPKGNATKDALDEDRDLIRSTVSHVISYNKLDNISRPRDGYYIQLRNDFTGLGGDVKFIKNILKAEYHKPIYGEDVIASLKAKGGVILELGQEIRLDDRFFLGDPDVRGFEAAGIGPRDAKTGDALGGKYFATLTGEVGFPIPFVPDEYGFRGAVFVDAGILGDPEDNYRTMPDPDLPDDHKYLDIDNNESIRASAGVSVIWSSPMGPIRANFAVPFLKEDEDKEEYFSIDFGTKF